MKCYSIYDKKGDEYAYPFQARSHADATRIVAEILLKGGTRLNLFPEDYVLYYVTNFDNVTGKFEFDEPSPVHVANISVIQASLGPKEASNG